MRKGFSIYFTPDGRAAPGGQHSPLPAGHVLSFFDEFERPEVPFVPASQLPLKDTPPPVRIVRTYLAEVKLGMACSQLRNSSQPAIFARVVFCVFVRSLWAPGLPDSTLGVCSSVRPSRAISFWQSAHGTLRTDAFAHQRFP